MAPHVAEAVADLLHNLAGGRGAGPQLEQGHHQSQDVKRGGADEHGGLDAEPVNHQPGQGRGQDANSVPDHGLHRHSVADMLPLHQAGEDTGPAGLVKGLADAGDEGD